MARVVKPRAEPLTNSHPQVSLQLTKSAIAKGHQVISQIRQPEHASDLPAGKDATQVEPILVSLEEATVPKLSSLFTKYDPNVIFFIAGAGGKGGPERTKAVDEVGAIKVFDAIEQSGLGTKETFRRFILCSAVDSRNIEKTKPEWYDDKE